MIISFANITLETFGMAIFSGMVAGWLASFIVPRASRRAYRMLLFVTFIGAVFTLPQVAIRFFDPAAASTSAAILLGGFVGLWVPFSVATWVSFWVMTKHLLRDA